MSEENVQAFCAKADTDEALGKKIAHVEPGDGALDQVVKIAAEAGFDVTASEIISAGRAALSDEELESVAGGLSNGSPCRPRTSASRWLLTWPRYALSGSMITRSG